MGVLTDYDAYCFDLDGTIYLGDELLPGVKETLAQLRRNEKKVLFITNSPTLTRESGRNRLVTMGIEAELEEVLTAPYLAARYFMTISPDASVFVVGEEAVVAELHQHSIQTTANPLAASHVLVGLDRSFTYKHLQQAMDAVRNGAKLIVTNPDPVCPVPGGFIPDTMSLAKAIEVASGQGICEVVGKPYPIYGNTMMELLEIHPEKILVIGDRLETDIQLGITKGFGTCLVLTGIAKKEDLTNSTIQPDYVIRSLEELVGVSIGGNI
ncbi:HAD-IIA family hydrolase [Bacillus sp. B15-48]|uniref:HAD-IIA family hydrolase n=1 Tax=Bacillus sp. B15-48 TaxID=1548601 RepID=UPI00193F4A8A|nr:HAD-IIA family hydrolase [Bacillus sp. B15-48]MBM4761147.1 HAD-IIA family hydrolase [Bacillus sp. B15-48]